MCRLRLLVADRRCPNADHVAIGERLLRHPYPVDERAIHRVEVDDREAALGPAYLRVMARDLGVAERDRAVGQPPDHCLFVAQHHPPAVGQAERSVGERRVALHDRCLHPQVALACVLISLDRDLDRAFEVVSVLSSVVARRIDELTHEGVVEAGKALDVVARQRHDELVGDDCAADAERASRVHLAHNAPSDLDGLQPASEGLAERAFDEPFQAALEPLESHRCDGKGSRTGLEDARRTGKRGRFRWYDLAFAREWRNWQTRRIQVPVPARAWGFKSPLAHFTSRHREFPRWRRGRAVRSDNQTEPAPDLTPSWSTSLWASPRSRPDSSTRSAAVVP